MGYGVCHEMCCNGLGFTLYKLADGLQIGKKIYLYLAEKILAVEVNSTNLL